MIFFEFSGIGQEDFGVFWEVVVDLLPGETTDDRHSEVTPCSRPQHFWFPNINTACKNNISIVVMRSGVHDHQDEGHGLRVKAVLFECTCRGEGVIDKWGKLHYLF